MNAHGVTANPQPLARPTVAATILAAGWGRRLGGRPKSALLLDGVSLLARLVAALREGGVAPVHVVLGPYPEVMGPLVQQAGALPVWHTNPAPTLIDSQRLAIQAHTQQHPGRDLMLVLADLPGLQAAHVLGLLAAWAQRGAATQAQVPMVDGERGHPVVLSWRAVQAVSAQPMGQGVRQWLAAHPEQVNLLPQVDRAFVSDLDTEEDIEALRGAWHPRLVTWPIW